MAYVTLNERSFAIVVNVAGTPGLRFDHPNLKFREGSDNADVLAALAACQETADALWAVMAEQSLCEKLEPLMKRSVAAVAESDAPEGSRIARTVASCRQALKAWFTPASWDEPSFVKAFGTQLYQAEGSEQPERQVAGVIG